MGAPEVDPGSGSREYNGSAVGGGDATHEDLVDALQQFGSEDFPGCAHRGESAVVQKNGAVGEGAGEVEVVAGQENGQVLVAGKRTQELGELELVLEVEKGVGLVEQEGFGLLGE